MLLDIYKGFVFQLTDKYSKILDISMQKIFRRWNCMASLPVSQNITFISYSKSQLTQPNL